MKRILLVEDSPMQSKWLISVLAKEGYDVSGESSAETAWKSFSAGEFDLVLTDLRLPGESGIELCRRIKSDPARSHTPVVLITGWADPLNVLRGLEAGMDGFVVKGSDLDAILEKIRQVSGVEPSPQPEADSNVTQFEFCGERFRIPNDRDRLLNVLLTTFAGVYDLSQQYKQEVVERKRAEAELQSAHDELEARVEQRTRSLREHALKLERANEELREFAYVASHDLQEPLRKIQAFSNRLQETCGSGLSEQGRNFLDRMLHAANRMRTLIADLLAYSRVGSEAGRFEPTDLSRIARDVASDLEMRIEETGGRVDIGSLPTIDADSTQIRQLLQNLIGNSLKFHREDVPPQVRVTADIVAGESSDECGPSACELCELCVEDNGIGFEDEYAGRIFNVFQRLHRRDEYEGTGVGLAVCRKIAERHGGSITATGVPGQGARFTVCLPVRQTAAAESAEHTHLAGV